MNNLYSVSHVQDSIEDMQSLDSCEYIWEAGVGFAQSPPLNYIHDINRWESGEKRASLRSHSHMSVYLSFHGDLLISNHTRRLKARTCFSTQTPDSDQLFRDQMSSLHVFTVQWRMFHSSVCL